MAGRRRYEEAVHRLPAARDSVTRDVAVRYLRTCRRAYGSTLLAQDRIRRPTRCPPKRQARRQIIKS